MDYPGMYKLGGSVAFACSDSSQRNICEILVLQLTIIFSFNKNIVSPNKVSLP